MKIVDFDAPSIRSQRITQKKKDANDHQWYKDQANLLDSGGSYTGFGSVDDNRRMKVNYDLYNNILDMSDLQYVCKPYGADTGEMPAEMANRDIVSGKIKVLLGMEMSMPFSYRLAAVNEEATTRKEQQEFGMLRDFVVSEIMTPIKQEIELQAIQRTQGRELTPEEKDDIKASIAKEIEAKTPDEVIKYMSREHQDPAEVQGNQILQYLMKSDGIKEKFNKGWKHSLLSGEEIYYVGAFNGEPGVKVINPLRFEWAKSDDLDDIKDGEWAKCIYRMTPSEMIKHFGSELSKEDVDRIYDISFIDAESAYSAIFDENSFGTEDDDTAFTRRAVHFVWKSLRKIGFLTYFDEKGKVQLDLVDENYTLDLNNGDIAIEWEWIPETHEVWKLMDDIFVYPRPVPGQVKDLYNLYQCDLPYIGASHDNLNSPTTAPMDRIKYYQYLFNIIIYRIELLMASDKGKLLAMNINSLPSSSGLTIEKFSYFMDANKIIWVNPNEEGNKGIDVTNMVKEIDMSLASDIAKYIQMAEYIEQKCGTAIGITPQMEAQIGSNEAVSNTRQNIVQSSHIIRPYFELHNTTKAHVLQALIDLARVIYSEGDPRRLSYVLDDMSIAMFKIDQGLLSGNRLGLFVANAAESQEAKDAIKNLSMSALQNQQATLRDIIKVIKSQSIQEAEELLEVAENHQAQQARLIEEQKLKAAELADRRGREMRREEMKHERDMVILKEKEKRKTIIQQQTIESMGFDPNKDQDDDGTPDVLEVAKFGVDADIKRRKQALEENKFNHQVENDEEKNEIENKKLKIAAKKKAST